MFKRFFTWVWSGIKAFLSFFGLIDAKGELSRTNLILYIFTVKFAFVPLQAAGIGEIAMAMASLGLYVGKKVLDSKAEARKETQAQSEMSDILDNVRSTGDDMTGDDEADGNT